jgi:hypothetical protein
VIEAAPRHVSDLASCWFYHSIDLPTYGPQHGAWDIRGRFDDYVAGAELRDRSMLDVGTATGYLTFEAERRGARATSFDVRGPDDYAELPVREAEYVYDRAAWRARRGADIEMMKNAYWLCHRDLGSSARCVYGDVYEINPSLGMFDVVLVGQILIHLRDAIAALTAAASVCADTLIITEGSFENDTPIAALSGRASKPDVAYAWYQYSTGWYREILAMLGFTEVAITTGCYLCHDAHHENEIELTTVVATRRRRARGLVDSVGSRSRAG